MDDTSFVLENLDRMHKLIDGQQLAGKKIHPNASTLKVLGVMASRKENEVTLHQPTLG